MMYTPHVFIALYVIVRLAAPCLGDSIQRARNFGNVCDSTIMLMMMIRKEKKSCLEKKDCLY